ncbi:hypothetical protein BMS3Abin11_02412 [bacterium BMS3Abin11]|nr:hypothetical protein BMS3Abin11_02412 [bacterium BMS3Abin11]
MDDAFKPVWASPPGDTIEELLLNKGMSHRQFADSICLSEAQVDKLIKGKKSITKKIAETLETLLGSTKSYWMKRDSQYKEDLLRYTAEASERKEWIKSIPAADMLNFGWIENTYSKELECLKYFEVSTVDEWYEKYNDILSVTSFRTSGSFDSTPESVVTWLKRGELISEKIISDSWNESSFTCAVNEARGLTRERDPEVFIPKLQKIFSKCGVAIVVEKSPKRCKASGAAFFVTSKKAVIMLSGRHLSDDHFWFSFFHEAGHILLHGNMELFLEFDDINKNNDDEEKEADKFAEKILIPDDFRDEFLSLNSREWKKIIKFAKKINTSAGIVLGQLQYFNKVDPRYLNKLKNRYKWSGMNLVRA